MKISMPNYYPDFLCIGSACQDNCCIGWEIDIDGATHAFYQSVPGSFGMRLRDSISEGDAPHFLLQKERCPFLDDQNLCEIIQTLGEVHLCEICDQHPRYYEWFVDLTEVGVGFCCEAAGNLIFTQQKPITFLIQEQPGDTAGETEDPVLLPALLAARQTAFALVQDRSYPITDRIRMLLLFGEALQACLAETPAALSSVTEVYQRPAFAYQEACRMTPHVGDPSLPLAELLHIYEGLEANSPGWPQQLQSIRMQLREILRSRPAFDVSAPQASYEYEHILVYFLHRYFLKAAFDLDILSKIHLALTSYLIIRLSDIFYWMHHNHAFSLEARVAIVKSYSKEIEYSQENLDSLQAESFDNPLFSLETLLQMLL